MNVQACSSICKLGWLSLGMLSPLFIMRSCLYMSHVSENEG